MIEKKILSNGILIVAEELPYLRSVSIGIWILTGSSSEDISNNGISHFLEHMLFKGTEQRSAKEIVEELDSVGGQLEAFTSREFTCYTAKVLDNHVSIALDVLHDMVVNSIFPNEEMRKEKGVVQEEIYMHEDTPQEQIHDLFASTIWKDHPLGSSILGTEKNVKNFTRETIMEYYKKHYCANNIVITAAGNLKAANFFLEVENLFSSLFSGKIYSDSKIPKMHTDIYLKKKDLEQVHFCLGTRGLSFTHPKRYSLYLLNSLLGGSMSSRLFQAVREKHGLVYSVYSYQASYKPSGLFAVYAGSAENNFEKVVEVVLDELNKLKKELISEKELSNNKEQLKGGITLNLENTESRMGHLAKSEIYFQEYITIEDIFKNIDNVKIIDIINFAQELFKPENMNMVVIGKAKEKFDERIKKMIEDKLS
ncbi:insulinase family protein [Candidatus Desantisbacteria bacterium]|nr:insulinase family protein [Candidatus Desantisbacteria bacterium]